MKEALPKIEALIFSSPNGISIEELGAKLKMPTELVNHYLNQLVKRYSDPQFGIEIVKENNVAKMKIKIQYADLISGKPELSKGILMTLSLIAVESPIKLADLVKKRGTVARMHVKKLREMGLISESVDKGKKIIKLSQGFFQYFDLSKEELESLKKEFQLKESENNQTAKQ